MSVDLALLRDGFTALSVDPSIAEHAAQRLFSALGSASPLDAAALRAQVLAGQWPELLDAFATDLGFGTGGCRGTVGLGPARFNDDTLARLIDAHARYLLATVPDASDRGVVLGWDTRCFHDVAERWALPTSLHGRRSEDFADVAAEVYGAHGIAVHRPATGGPVGALSAAVRRVGAAAGLYISASHNPPDDNGAKLYDHGGCQLVPPEDGAVLDWLRSDAPKRGTPGVRVLPESVRQDWRDALHAVVQADLTGLVVAYTALHGAGADEVPRALRRAGATVHSVDEQQLPDGRFGSLPDRSPNPESPRALERAVALGHRVGASLVLGTDPDADRLGAVVLRGADSVRLNGQQLAALWVDEALNTAPAGAAVLTTAVTTRRVRQLAEGREVVLVDDTPVGFKFLGQALDRLGIPLAIAVEESHGAMVSEVTRDKDAVGAALLLARAAARGDLNDRLAALDQQYGPLDAALLTRTLAGVGARDRLAASLSALRQSPPTVLGGLAVERVDDWWQTRRGDSPTERAAHNVVRLFCAGAVLTVRPSGTEPKVKVYAERWDGGAAAPLAQALMDLLSAESP